jgi:hypothetical protein
LRTLRRVWKSLASFERHDRTSQKKSSALEMRRTAVLKTSGDERCLATAEATAGTSTHVFCLFAPVRLERRPTMRLQQLQQE